MTELQYLILKEYYTRKQINSYEFYHNFPLRFPQYTLAQIKTEVGFLHTSLFIDSPPGTFNTLGITREGESKFNLEETALSMRKRFGESEAFSPLPPLKEKSQEGDLVNNGSKVRTTNIKRIVDNAITKWVLKYIIEIIIGGVIAGLLTTYIIVRYKIPH